MSKKEKVAGQILYGLRGRLSHHSDGITLKEADDITRIFSNTFRSREACLWREIMRYENDEGALTAWRARDGEGI